MLCCELYPFSTYIYIWVQTHEIFYVKPLQLTVARIGSDLGLFELLAQNGGEALTIEELAQKTGADGFLLSMWLL